MKQPQLSPSDFIRLYRNDIVNLLSIVEDTCDRNGWSIVNRSKLFKSLFYYIYKHSDRTKPNYDQ